MGRGSVHEWHSSRLTARGNLPPQLICTCPKQDQNDSLIRLSSPIRQSGATQTSRGTRSPGLCGCREGDRAGSAFGEGGSGEPDRCGWAGRGCGREPGNDRSNARAGGGASVFGGQPVSRSDALQRHTGGCPAGAQTQAGCRSVVGAASAPERGSPAAVWPLLGGGGGARCVGNGVSGLSGGGHEFCSGQLQRR